MRFRFSAALSAVLLLFSILAVPASATIAGLPDDPLGCIVDPLNPLSCIPDPLGGGIPDPLGGGLPGVGGGLPGTPGGGTPDADTPDVPPSPIQQPPTSTLPPLPGGKKKPKAPKHVKTPKTGPVQGPSDSTPTDPKRATSPASADSPASSPGSPSHSASANDPALVTAPPAVSSATVSSRHQIAHTRSGDSREHSSGRTDNSAASLAKRLAAETTGGLAASAGAAVLKSSAPAASPAPRQAALVSQAFDRIPEQYRWPVFVLACLATFLGLNSLRERRRSLRIEDRAMTDSLTRLPNRSAFQRRLAKEWKRADRYDRPLSMLLLDLDGFKQINDTQGHAAGDEVLRHAATAISSHIRSSDMAARLGGDEFVVLCPETSAAEAETLARSLEKRLRSASIRTSVGFAERELEDEGVPEYLVARADASMYLHKQHSGAARDRRSNGSSSLRAKAVEA